MSGKILIVDDVATNRIVLRVKLASTFYDVRQANTLAEAMVAVAADLPDLVIVSTRLPGGPDGQNGPNGPNGTGALALARALRARGETADLPLLALGPAMAPAARAEFLAADFDDVLAKPVDDHFLQARLRSLTRARDAVQDLRLRESARAVMGFADPSALPDLPARIMLSAPSSAAILPWRPALESRMPHRLAFHDHSALLPVIGGGANAEAVVLVIPVAAPESGLRLLSELRAHPAARRMALLVVFAGVAPAPLMSHALDLGAEAVMGEGADMAEIALRLGALLRRKRLADRLHASVRHGLQAAVTDPLTGLFNRRYALPQLERLLAGARDSGQPLAVMVADLDHFKRINDSYGHAAGDAVLIEVAARLRDGLCDDDLLARIGGEEFLIALPDCPRPAARARARALCARIGNLPFALPGRESPVHVTVSIGVAVAGSMAAPDGIDGTQADWGRAVQALLGDADRALYGAKAHGRNTVTVGRPAA
jgi:two-component system cell cycle response regulator